MSSQTLLIWKFLKHLSKHSLLCSHQITKRKKLNAALIVLIQSLIRPWHEYLNDTLSLLVEIVETQFFPYLQVGNLMWKFFEMAAMPFPCNGILVGMGNLLRYDGKTDSRTLNYWFFNISNFLFGSMNFKNFFYACSEPINNCALS